MISDGGNTLAYPLENKILTSEATSQIPTTAVADATMIFTILQPPFNSLLATLGVPPPQGVLVVAPVASDYNTEEQLRLSRTYIIYPLTTAIGLVLSTILDIPALLATLTTSVTSL